MLQVGRWAQIFLIAHTAHWIPRFMQQQQHLDQFSIVEYSSYSQPQNGLSPGAECAKGACIEVEDVLNN